MRNERRAIVLLVFILIAVFLFQSYLFWYGHMHSWSMNIMHGDFKTGIYGLLNPLLLISFVVILLFSFFTPNKSNDAAVESLKIKYVRGEITKDEYVKMFRDIIQGRP